MDKYEVRRLRLLDLIDNKCGGKINALAAKIDRSDSYVSRMLYEEGKAGKKRIGEDMADLITEKFDLPMYWLDGDFAPLNTSDQAREIARAFDALSPDLQKSLIGVIEGFGVKVRRVDPEPKLAIATPKKDVQQADQGSFQHGKQQSSGSSSSE